MPNTSGAWNDDGTWMDYQPYPGPHEGMFSADAMARLISSSAYYSMEEIRKAFIKIAEVYFQPPKHVGPRPRQHNHGPRSGNTFDRRGRRRY